MKGEIKYKSEDKKFLKKMATKQNANVERKMLKSF